MATIKMMAVTPSKQWIHFFRSDRWPPTSNILKGNDTFHYTRTCWPHTHFAIHRIIIRNIKSFCLSKLIFSSFKLHIIKWCFTFWYFYLVTNMKKWKQMFKCQIGSIYINSQSFTMYYIDYNECAHAPTKKHTSVYNSCEWLCLYQYHINMCIRISWVKLLKS